MGKIGLRAAYGRAATVTGAIAALSAGFLLIAGPASAHTAPITGSAVCSSNGTYTVTYQVHVSTVDDKQISWNFVLKSTAPPGSSVEAFNPTGFGDSTLTLVQINVPEVASTARVIGEVTWADGYTSGDQTGTVPLTGVCPSGSVTPPSTPPSTTPPSSSAPTSAGTTSSAPTSAGTTSSAPSTVATTTTPATTAPAGTTSSVIAPPAPSTSAATTAPVSSFNNAPPPPTTHAVEATSATNATTSAVAIDVPSPSPSVSTVSSPALASTGLAQPVAKTLGWAGLLASVGALLLVLARRRQHS